MLYGIGGTLTHLRLPDDEGIVILVGAPPVKILVRHLDVVSSPQFTLNEAKPASEIGPSDITMTWTRTPGIVGPTYINLPVALCVASVEQEPSTKVRAMYESLAQRGLPEGHRVPADWDDVTADGLIKEGHRLPMMYMPRALQDDAKRVYERLCGEANRVVRMLRWRFAAEMEYRPIAFPDYYWSFDNKVLHSMPHSTDVAWGLGVTELPSAVVIGAEVGKLLEVGAIEPFAHVLFGEAWQQRHENPRSAIVMGISAAEVGFKQFASQAAPVTAWLMENVPSPPLISMVWDYLPILLGALPVTKPLLAPPRDDKGRPNGILAKALLDGVAIRNKVVHAGGETIKGETVERVLKGVADLLWLLDFLKGFEWALEHVSEITVQEWTVTS